LQYRVRSFLLDQIRSGKVMPGDRLPTEQELEDRFGVSRITVRNAVSQLEGMGLLFRRAGQGTFVAQPKIEQELSRLTGFVEDMHAIGMTASARVEKIAELQAPAYVALRLGLKVGEKVTYIERVRLGDDEPLSYDVTYLPIGIGRRVARENLIDNPIFDLLERKYGMKLGSAEYTVESTTASRDIARHLHIGPGDPVLLVERTTRDRNGKSIDYEKLHYRGDRFRYRVTVQR
jgi:GntR family transcriptional regulator